MTPEKPTMREVCMLSKSLNEFQNRLIEAVYRDELSFYTMKGELIKILLDLSKFNDKYGDGNFALIKMQKEG